MQTQRKRKAATFSLFLLIPYRRERNRFSSSFTSHIQKPTLIPCTSSLQKFVPVFLLQFTFLLLLRNFVTPRVRWRAPRICHSKIITMIIIKLINKRIYIIMDMSFKKYMLSVYIRMDIYIIIYIHIYKHTHVYMHLYVCVRAHILC